MPHAEPALPPALSVRLDAAVKIIAARAPVGFVPRVGVVLGSGLGAFADTLTELVKLPYAEVGLPASSIVGHAGNQLREVGRRLA